MKVTYYGHSCFSVVIQNKHLVFDPYISANQFASDIDVDQIKADYIFVSHAHFDHIGDVERIANNTGAVVISNWELTDYFKREDLKNVRPINPGGQFTADFGTVKCVSSIHSSSLPDGTYGGIACGFVFKSADGNFYFSGDTGLTMDMQLITRWAKLDFAVLPIGDVLTMGIQEAIEASRFVGVNKVLAVHYDTFASIRIDRQKAVAEFEAAGIELFLMEIGSTIEL
ncbi:metal-dependent hydrolase [Mucilaginibacter sp. cycad4]|uniref:metal-dependent hydrolase n=1 Tax=Mucilaginibacter sp. cycad4 TaxID=3342096 RepID=UPI002AAAD106|nr:metal-dependent hydrolase [Mucilaginibacter gossypii]WPU99147.1 metal-dependent hydrolase [Mucilaginibacter gossypii]